MIYSIKQFNREISWYLIVISVIIASDLAICLDIEFLRPILSFLCFTIIPGLLILHIMDFDKIDLLEKFAFSIGLSVFFLMFLGAIINNYYFEFGCKFPLSTYSLMISFSVLMFILCVLLYIKNPNKYIRIRFNFKKSSERSYYLISLYFPIISIFGAVFMNMTNNNKINLLLLVIIIVYVFFISLYYGNSASNEAYPFSILMISISLLFMQSLRSDQIVGMDIFQESRLAQDVISYQYWDIQYKNGLNSCLCVAILLPVYHFLTGISVNFVIKIICPLIYSITPLCVYLISKEFLAREYAFLASFLFMSQIFYLSYGMVPVRTGFAVFFCALFLFIFTTGKIKNKQNTFLFIIFITGIIFSHYTTSYLLFLVMLAAAATNLLLKLIIRRNKYAHFPEALNNNLTINIVMVFFVLIFLWYGQMTGVQFDEGIKFLDRTFINLNYYFNGEMKTTLVSQHITSGSYLAHPSIAYRIAYLSQILTFSLIGLGCIYVDLKEIVPKVSDKFQAIISYSKFPNYIYENKGISFLHMILSSIIICTLFFILVIPFIGYDYQRPFMVGLILLAPLYIIGCRLILNPVNKHASVIIAAAIILQFLCASGVVFVISGLPHPSNIPLYQQKGEYVAYVHDQDISSLRWLYRAKGNFYAYGDDHARYISSIVSLLDNTSKIRFGNIFYYNKRPLNNIYIYLRYFNIVTKSVVIQTSPEVIDNFSNYSPLFLNKNNIYSTGESKIFF